ncbi:MAG: phosphatidate cytidylyltransferase [Planctomycetaceae bacterium]
MIAPAPHQPAPDSAAARARASVASRVTVATVVIAVFTGLVWADAVGLGGAPPAWWLAPLVVAVAARGAAEFAGLFAAAGAPIRGRLVQLLAVFVAVSAGVGAQAATVVPDAPRAVPLGWTAAAITAALVVLLAAEVAGYARGTRALDRVASGALVVAWLGLPLAFMVALRLLCVEDLGPEQRGPGHLGILPLVSLVAVVKAGDIAAYVVGSLLGRTKMAPQLSPGKTWEGATASLLASLAAAWFVIERAGLAAGARPWGGWPLYGLAVGAAGMLGDLAESLAKRELGAKDSGRMLGGLGGVLDLVDSLLLAAPVAWLLWAAGR